MLIWIKVIRCHLTALLHFVRRCVGQIALGARTEDGVDVAHLAGTDPTYATAAEHRATTPARCRLARTRSRGGRGLPRNPVADAFMTAVVLSLQRMHP